VRGGQALVMNESEFTHILRILNTNIDGRQKVMFAMTNIKGCGRRFSNLVLKKAEIDMNKRYARARCCEYCQQQSARALERRREGERWRDSSQSKVLSELC
jgi:hypothetical protein